MTQEQLQTLIDAFTTIKAMNKPPDVVDAWLNGLNHLQGNRAPIIELQWHDADRFMELVSEWQANGTP